MKLRAALAVLACATAAHADTAIAIKPHAQARCTDDPEVTVAIEVVPRGVWLGTSSGARCFVARKGTSLDPDALDAELQTIVASLAPGCSTHVDAAAVAGVSYQDVITATDHAIKAGLVELGIRDPRELAAYFTDTRAKEKAAPAHCTVIAASTPSSAKPAASAASSFVAPPAPRTKESLATAPIVIVSRTEVTLDGASMGTVKAIARGKGAIAALVTALRASGVKGPLVLQADFATDAAVLNRVIASAHDAGFDDVLFAVKTK